MVAWRVRACMRCDYVGPDLDALRVRTDQPNSSLLGYVVEIISAHTARIATWSFVSAQRYQPTGTSRNQQELVGTGRN